MAIKRKNKSLSGIAVFMAAFLMSSYLNAGVLAEESSRRMLIPMGNTVGIQMSTDGVLVVGLAVLETSAGSISPAGDAGIQPGDLIVKLGSRDVKGAAEFVTAVADLTGDPILVTLVRKDKQIQVTVTPKKVDTGYRLGLFLRDSVTGIGTVTFLDPETGFFGALGHPISDIDTGVIMPLGSGVIMDSSIIEVRKGIAGTPGELCGSFDWEAKRGSIEQNTPLGIFGCMPQFEDVDRREPMPVAYEDEIVLGEAAILANVSGTKVEEYRIEISRIYKNDGSGRSMMIVVTDPDLIAQTGGIVQGMSGSPIIQNGRIVGAVTHVLVNDPARGYGVSADKMLSASENQNGSLRYGLENAA